MTTIRVARRARYTSVDRRTITDKRLSFRARGLLVWLLDKPDDWRTSAALLAAESTEGDYAIRMTLRELERAGYLERTKLRTAAGTWATEWVVHEVPPGANTADGPGAIIADGPPANIADGDQVAPHANIAAHTEDLDNQQKTELTEAQAPLAPLTVSTSVLLCFDTWWKTYPRRQGKGAALKKYVAALRTTSAATLLSAAERYRDDPNREAQFTCMPATWLHQERWNDEALPSRGKSPTYATKLIRRAAASAAAREGAPNGHGGNDRGALGAAVDSLPLRP